MKAHKLIIATAIAVITITACQKDKKQAPADPAHAGHRVELGNLKPVPQKIYAITGQQALAIVKKFKGLEQPNLQNGQARLIEADSVALDSSVFVIEAALNYDFDYHTTHVDNQLEDLPVDTLEYSIPLVSENGLVNSDDLEAVYEELTTLINARIDDDIKIKIVDIEAYIFEKEDNEWHVSYKALLIRHYLPVQQYWCGTNTNSGAACSTSSLSPAATIVQYYLRHCDFPLTDCPSSFYTQVSSTSYDNQSNAYSGALYYYFASPATILDNTVLAASQINSYRSGCYTLAANFASGTSSNHKIVAAYITSTPAVLFPSPVSKSVWKWVASFTCAIPVLVNC